MDSPRGNYALINESLLQCWVGKGRAVDNVYLDFGKAFDAASCDNLIGKLTKH